MQPLTLMQVNHCIYMHQIDVFFLYLSGAKSYKRNRRMRIKRRTGKSYRYRKRTYETGVDYFNNRRRKLSENAYLLLSEQKDILLDKSELEMGSGIMYNGLQTIHQTYNPEIDHFQQMDRTLSEHSRRKNIKLIKKRRRNGYDDILSSGSNVIATIGAESKQIRRDRSKKTERKNRTEQNRRGNERMIDRELERIHHTRSLFTWYPNDNTVTNEHVEAPTVSSGVFTQTQPSRITGGATFRESQSNSQTIDNLVPYLDFSTRMRSALSPEIRSKIQQAISKIVSAHREQCKTYIQLVRCF